MLDYCDYIIRLVRNNLLISDTDDQRLLAKVLVVRYDLDKDGVLNSTKKFMTVTDINGKKYKITVEVEDE